MCAPLFCCLVDSSSLNNYFITVFPNPCFSSFNPRSSISTNPHSSPPHILLTNKAVTVCICTCHISQDATQISNQHHMPDPVTFQCHTQHAHIHTHYHNPHLTPTPSPLHTNLPESCPPFRSCSLTLGVPFKTWAEKRGRTHVISTRVHTYCDTTLAMATSPDFIFGLEHTGGLIIQMTSGDRRRGKGGE